MIRTRVASQPSGIWFANYSPSTVTNDVRTLVTAASGKVPVLVIYEIPNRDCGGASAGGAPDIASYEQYITNFANGLGNASALIMLEPDSVALQTCVSGQTLSDRNSALAFAGATLHAKDPNVKVYYDGGHSAWNSATRPGQPPDRGRASRPAATASSRTSPTSTPPRTRPRTAGACSPC